MTAALLAARLDAADFSNLRERQYLARAVAAEVRQHYATLHILMDLCTAEAEAAGGKPALVGEMAHGGDHASRRWQVRGVRDHAGR